MRRILLIAAGWIAAAGLVAACDDGPAEETEEFLDCREVCNDFEDCVGANRFDASDCTVDCEDRADLDEEFADRVDECDDCLDFWAETQQCSLGEYPCEDVCEDIVPDPSTLFP